MEPDRASPVRLHHHELAWQAVGQPSGYRATHRLDTTATGLKVCCGIDGNLYPKGLKVTDQEIQAINISRNELHGEWNYSIAPNQQPP
jgi:Rhodopirellula transposase DDE domain